MLNPVIVALQFRFLSSLPDVDEPDDYQNTLPTPSEKLKGSGIVVAATGTDKRRISMESQENNIKLLTLSEVATILKISKRTLHRMIQHRQIPAFKVGGQWRILESRFQEWMQVEEQSAARLS